MKRYDSMKHILCVLLLPAFLFSAACAPASKADAPAPEAPVSAWELAATPSPKALPTSTPTPALTLAPAPSPTPEPTPAPRAVLMFTGDLMCLRAQQKIAKSKKGYDFSPSFSRVTELLSSADLTVGNLETVIDDSIPYTLDVKQDGGTPYCNAPSSFLDAVKEAGFDAIVTANNHCCDCGEAGILATLDALDARELPHTGTFRGDEARFLLMDVNGIRVALIANTATVNGNESDIAKERRDTVLNLYSPAAAKADIAAARAAGADFVVVCMHGGTENSHKVSARQTMRAQELADAGADLIIGSHPHVLQEAAYIHAADGREVPCFYSLGNFISSMDGVTGNRDTVILRVELTQTDNCTVLSDIGFIGARTLLEKDRLIVTPVSPVLNGGRTDPALTEAQERIAGRLGSGVREISSPDALSAPEDAA